MFGCRPSDFQQLRAGDAARARAVDHQPGLLDVAAGEVQRIDQAGRRDDRGAVLVVVEHRDVEQLAQPLLDDEALRRLDVFEVDAAPALAEESDAIDELVRILGVHFEIDRVDIGEALEQHRLAFHHGLGGERAAIAEAEDRGAVGDDGDEIALRRVVVGLALILGDRQHRHRDAGRIGEREIALRRHRLGGDDFELARPALAVEQQRFLVGERRPRLAARIFCQTFQPLKRRAPWARRNGQFIGAAGGGSRTLDRSACRIAEWRPCEAGTGKAYWRKVAPSLS